MVSNVIQSYTGHCCNYKNLKKPDISEFVS